MSRNSSLLLLVSVLGLGCGESGPGVSGYAGTYGATLSASYMNTTPNTESGTYSDAATVTIADEPEGRIKVTWKVGANPPSGVIVFALSGASGSAVGTGTGGDCFNGVLANGNTQTTCCETCSISFQGTSFTQNQAGSYTGTTAPPQSALYAGTYTGVWTGNRTSP